MSPGAGAPSGRVTFSVAGEQVGSAAVVSGTAVLDHTVPAGASRQVAIAYFGDGRFTGSSDSLARRDPTIAASVSSRTSRTKHGWYRSPVRVTFECELAGAPLVEACPSPVTLRRNGAAQSVTRTIAATDGGMSSVTAGGIDIDRTAPKVRVVGVRDGATYYGTGPRPTCLAQDALSGVARCTVRLRDGAGGVTRYRVRAVDRAGNATTVSGSYRTSTIQLREATFTKGAWNVRPGRTYTVVVLSTSRPTYRFASPSPRRPGPGGTAFHRAGAGRWALAVTMDDAMRAHRYWNLGVEIDGTLSRVRVRTR